MASSILEEPFQLTDTLRLRNRFVATAHGRAAVVDGMPTAADAEYWRRLAEGGAAMCIAGGTATAADSTYRTRVLTEAWRPEAVPGLKLRADAMHAGGAAAILQLVHLGRETLGAEIYYHPVAPSAVRSPREPTRPRPAIEADIDEIVDGFRLAAMHAAEAGFDGIELHAAHGYLLAQFLSAATNRRPDAGTIAGRLELLERVADTVRSAAPGKALGVRLSVGDPEDAGLTFEEIEQILPALSPTFDYINLTVGMRADYVRDMATTRPPLLDDVARLRRATERPLLISHGFRDADAMVAAREAGADLVGMARALIADPDLPRKVLAGRAREVRPCVACNEDCRAFDPTLLCSVNPDLAAPGDAQRRAAPLVRGAARQTAARRVAIVGAGPAGLETALTLRRAGGVEVVVFDQAERIGGTLAHVAAAPHRSGWQRILDYYARNLDGVELRLGERAEPAGVEDFDAVVVATGAEEIAPAGLRSVTQALAAGADGLRGIEHLAIVDDGFGWWPAVNALELAVAAGVGRVTVVTPGTAFANAIPPESRTQLLKRLRGAVEVDIRAMSAYGDAQDVQADAVIAVGERRPRDWSQFEREDRSVVVIGDAIVPRRVAHAISEGRAAARLVLAEAPVASLAAA